MFALRSIPHLSLGHCMSSGFLCKLHFPGPLASGLRLRPCEALQGLGNVRAMLRSQAIFSPLSLPQTVPQKGPCLLCEEPQTPLSCSGRCSCTATSSFPSHLLMALIAGSLFLACMPFISYQDFATSSHIQFEY